MKTLLFDRARWQRDSDGTWLCLRTRSATDICDFVTDGKEYEAKVTEHREHRSKSANAYMWVLLGELAEVLSATDPNVTKDTLYLWFVKHHGIYKEIALEESVAKTFKTVWQNTGKGWPTEDIDFEPDGKILVRFYYGSSTYNTKQMSRLIDAVVEECKTQGIQTMTPNELENLKSMWEGEKI